MRCRALEGAEACLCMFFQAWRLELRITCIWKRIYQATGMVSSWLATFQIKVLV
ncbi:MAG: hypothetical protein A4E49_02654 [Methanosaeta sp. PtaU1.Bin112]|nr:MAG: hypothetical protein A4E49_02654 [Methanosaeta sp. PtaU1.Bin112]